MRLIDATTLKAEFTGNFTEAYPPAHIKALIDVAPEIDPVHAAGGVYCRECKFSEERSYKYIFCKAVDRHPARWCRYDDFCSRGIKREARTMDKLEVLRWLDQLHFEMVCAEDKTKKLCNDSSNLYYIKWAKGALEKVRSVIIHVEESAEVTELCPHCESEVTLHWDVKDRGYKAYCPVCGERLMLCSACHDDGYGCDYDTETDGCRGNPAEERKNENAD